MAAEEYGTIGMRPMGAYDPDTKYGLLNLVEYDGSSYVAHTDPPVGTLPTNLAYWQVSAQGTGKATADSVGTVKPDGTTTEVSTEGSMSVKTALQDALGLVKGSDGIKVGADGSIDVNTLFTQAAELANLIAGEAIATALGKISKSIAVTMGLNENALFKSMLTNMDVNDSTKVNSAAYIHKLTERIGMGEELAAGANLTAAFNVLNSNLTNISDNLANVNNNISDMTFDGSLLANTQKGSANMDNVIVNGFYTIVSATNNAPFTGAFGLIVVGNNSSTNAYCSQTAYSFSTGSIKNRTKAGSSGWTVWKTISTT